MSKKNKILVTYGDGIGPEIMQATLSVLAAAKADLDIQVIDIGEKTYLKGYSTGIKPEDWDALRTCAVFLKAPITTPQGGGYKSLNVTIRKALGLYANIRPCQSFYPFVPTKHPIMDLVIVRENEEDLYAGIEYQQTREVAQSLKLISRPGSEIIMRYAFDFAVKNNRKKVTCFSKDNIMKMTDGLFHRIFDEIGAHYPQIEKEHLIVDIGAARLADTPEIFDVIVMENLYGDILSDVAAQIAGSVGMSGSANIGLKSAMFEAIHGSAPSIAGKNIANPSALLNAANQMLVHIQQKEVAQNIQNAWLRTIEDGIHTEDIFSVKYSKQKVGTKEFAQAVIERLGKKPSLLKPAVFAQNSAELQSHAFVSATLAEKKLVGVDIYLDFQERNPDLLAEKMASAMDHKNLKMEMISNRGLKVWPSEIKGTFCTDHWRVRFFQKNPDLDYQDVLSLLNVFYQLGLDVIKTENLYEFGSEKGYSLPQG